MLLKVLNKFFPGNKGHESLALVPEQEDIPRYPPFAKGLPAADTKRILETQSELITRIKGILRFTAEDFAEIVNPVIENYAAYVHLLPASEAHHHRGAGGLFRHGLEVGFWAAQQAEAHQFCIDETPCNKRDNEPRWQFAAFLGGLLHDVGKPLSDVAVTNLDGSQEWNPYESSLATWTMTEEVDHYFLRWRDKRNKRHEKFSMMNLDQILTQKAKSYLNKPGPNIMESLLESIVGTSAQETLTQLVLWADQESVRRDLVNQRMDVDEYSYGVPVERFVFDALRRLAIISKVNEPGAMIWRTEHAVFLAWKSIVTEVHNLIEKDKIPGIPRNHDTLADILVERGFAIPYQETAESKPVRYWNIYPECLEGIGLMCLRIDDIELIFSNEPPPPIKASLSKPLEKRVARKESNVVLIAPKEPEKVKENVAADEHQNMDDMDEYIRCIHEPSFMEHPPTDYQPSSVPDTAEVKSSIAENKQSKDPVRTQEKTWITKLASVAEEVEIEMGEVVQNVKANNKKPSDKPKPTEKKKILFKDIQDEVKPIEKSEGNTKNNKKPDNQNHGPAWEIINKAIEITGAGKKKPILIKLNSGNYGIPYPNAARQLGEPREIMNILSDDGLLSISPIAVTKTTTIDGEKYLVIESKATNYINGKLSNINVRKTKPDKVNNKMGKTNNDKKELIKFDSKQFQKDFIEQIVSGFGCYIEGDVEVKNIDGKTRYSIKTRPILERIRDYYNWDTTDAVILHLQTIHRLDIEGDNITFWDEAL